MKCKLWTHVHGPFWLPTNICGCIYWFQIVMLCFQRPRSHTHKHTTYKHTNPEVLLIYLYIIIICYYRACARVLFHWLENVAYMKCESCDVANTTRIQLYHHQPHSMLLIMPILLCESWECKIICITPICCYQW